MRKLLHEVKIIESKNTIYGFAFLPKIVIEAHPTHKRWHIIWLEAYEKSYGKNWLIEKS